VGQLVLRNLVASRLAWVTNSTHDRILDRGVLDALSSLPLQGLLGAVLDGLVPFFAAISDLPVRVHVARRVHHAFLNF
jgi:hypothetical protein